MRYLRSGAVSKYVILIAISIFSNPQFASAQQATQCFSIEFFYDSSTGDASELRASLEKFADERKGLLLNFRDVHEDEKVQQRLDQIAKHFGLAEISLPAMYGLNNIIADLKSKEQVESRLSKILQLTAYVRNGCPHCAAAKAFLGKYGDRYPALKIVYNEVITSQAANQEMQAVVRRYRQQAASLPVIHYCNGLTIGFDREATTGRKVMQTLDYWSRACSDEKKTAQKKASRDFKS